MKMGSFWISVLVFLRPKITTLGWDELLTSGVAAVYIPKIFNIVIQGEKKINAVLDQTGLSTLKK